MNNQNNEENIYKKLNDLVNKEKLETKDKPHSMMEELDKDVQLCVELINNINIDETNTDLYYMDDLEKKIDNSSYYYSLLTDGQKTFISKKSEYKKLISMIKEFDESECQINEVKNSIDDIPLLASDSKYADISRF